MKTYQSEMQVRRLQIIDRNTIQLLRTSFSYFLMPVFFFALSQVQEINWSNVIICFFALHLFIYPASNGYNSYMDEDEGSIGGLEHPPKPTKKLFYASVIFDIIGLVLALSINIYFMLSVFVYILASRAYSYRRIRLKKYPVTSFITVIFFQGAFTYWMVYAAISVNTIEISNLLFAALAGCSFLIGGVYPLTQIYQHEEDYVKGDVTISYILGIKGTFVFTAIMFLIANIFLYFYFNSINEVTHFLLLQLFMLPVVINFVIWFIKVLKDIHEASFKNTMRMNFIAATCMNTCFILLLILNITK